MGAKLRPRLRREVSAAESIWEERLKIFIVFGISVFLSDRFLRPPLQPLL